MGFAGAFVLGIELFHVKHSHSRLDWAAAAMSTRLAQSAENQPRRGGQSGAGWARRAAASPSVPVTGARPAVSRETRSALAASSAHVLLRWTVLVAGDVLSRHASGLKRACPWETGSALRTVQAPLLCFRCGWAGPRCRLMTSLLGADYSAPCAQEEGALGRLIG